MRMALRCMLAVCIGLVDLSQAGVNTSLYVVKGGGHGLRGGEESPEKLFEMVADFFDKHLKKPKPGNK